MERSGSMMGARYGIGVVLVLCPFICSYCNVTRQYNTTDDTSATQYSIGSLRGCGSDVVSAAISTMLHYTDLSMNGRSLESKKVAHH